MKDSVKRNEKDRLEKAIKQINEIINECSSETTLGELIMRYAKDQVPVMIGLHIYGRQGYACDIHVYDSIEMLNVLSETQLNRKVIGLKVAPCDYNPETVEFHIKLI